MGFETSTHVVTFTYIYLDTTKAVRVVSDKQINSGPTGFVAAKQRDEIRSRSRYYMTGPIDNFGSEQPSGCPVNKKESN